MAVLQQGHVARADDLAEFERGRNSYEAGRYKEAADRFQSMLDPGSRHVVREPLIVQKVRTYYVGCLIALERSSDADAQIETLLRDDPSFSPDPAVFPGVVLDRFADVRARIRQDLETRARQRAEADRLAREKAIESQRREQERFQALEALAKQEVHVQHNSRWVAMIPFGAGQFQNGQTALGWSFLAVETSLAVTTIVTSGIVQSLQSQGLRSGVDTVELNNRVDQARGINNVAWAALMAIAVGGVAHAQLTYVPEAREIRGRPLPKGLRVTPSAGIEAGRGWMGILGLF